MAAVPLSVGCPAARVGLTGVVKQLAEKPLTAGRDALAEDGLSVNELVVALPETTTTLFTVWFRNPARDAATVYVASGGRRGIA